MKKIFFLAFSLISFVLGNAQNTMLSLHTGKAITDTLRLLVYPRLLGEYGNDLIPHQTFVLAPNKTGSYQVPLSLQEPGYLQLLSGRCSVFFLTPIPLLDFYIVEPGDKVTITINQKDTTGPSQKQLFYRSGSYYVAANENRHLSVRFSGRGSAKYTYRYYTDSLSAFSEWTSKGAFANQRGGRENGQLSVELGILDSLKDQLSPIAYKMLVCDAKGRWAIEKQRYFLVLAQKTGAGIADRQPGFLDSLAGDFYAANAITDSSSLWVQAKYLSRFYLQSRLGILNNITGFKESMAPYAAIKKEYTGLLLEKMLLLFLADSQDRVEKRDSLIADAEALLKNKTWKNYFSILFTGLRPGKFAPDFTLPDHRQKLVSLRDFRGKVVLLDFWFTGCAGCTDYYSKVMKPAEEILAGNKDIVFITIAVDGDRAGWEKSIRSGKYTSFNNVNLYTGGKGVAHEVIKNYYIHTYPMAFLIGKDGRFISLNMYDIRSKGKEHLLNMIEKAIK